VIIIGDVKKGSDECRKKKKIHPKLSNILVFQDLGCRKEQNISSAAIIVDVKKARKYTHLQKFTSITGGT
jgi:ribosomal protein L31